MNVRVFSDDLTRLNTTHAMLLDEARLALDFTEVDPGTKAGRRLLCFEQSSSINYSNIPSDQLPNLISGIKERLWTIVQSIPPYRKYYLYMSPASEQSQVLPQLASAYMLMFFLSTVTRYRPQDFDQLLGERDGPFLTEFLDSQPKQFIYLMASEFAQREITQPAIVH